MGVVNRPVLPHERGCDRVDVKKYNSVIVGTSAAGISIEDSAQFKCRVEIDLTRSQAAADWLSISFSRQGERNYRVRLRGKVRIAATKRLTRNLLFI